MRAPTRSRLCLLTAFLTISPYTPQHILELARTEVGVPNKITLLRRFLQSFPQDPSAAQARDQLTTLLQANNRYEEALQVYDQKLDAKTADEPLDLIRLDLLLKTGRYAEVLRLTATPHLPTRDFLRDERLLELRVQALLAGGHYRRAREAVDQWLGMYERDGNDGNRFADDVQSLLCLRRHLQALETLQGPTGKALFTAAVPDSLTHWSRRHAIPIVFFQLQPADAPTTHSDLLLRGRHATDATFEQQVRELNRGFNYLSSGAFSLSYAGLHTLYVKQTDLGPASAHSSVLTARVYVHTIPPLYRLAGKAFVVLIDYDAPTEDEAAYMGDGLIHLSATKLRTITLMHEILHGLGATHQGWQGLESQGFQFDPGDRGLMTFDHGELRDLGLEEKNRVLLGWPHVAVVHLTNDTAALPADPTLTPS